MLVEIGGKCSSVIIYFLSDLHNRNENRRLLHKERMFYLKDLFLKVSSLITFLAFEGCLLQSDGNKNAKQV